MTGVRRFLQGLAGIVVSSLVLIVLALVYFVVTAWIVRFGVDLVTGNPPSPDFIALSAALLSIGGLAGSTFTMGSSPGEGSVEDDYADQEVV